MKHRRTLMSHYEWIFNHRPSLSKKKKKETIHEPKHDSFSNSLSTDPMESSSRRRRTTGRPNRAVRKQWVAKPLPNDPRCFGHSKSTGRLSFIQTHALKHHPLKRVLLVVVFETLSRLGRTWNEFLTNPWGYTLTVAWTTVYILSTLFLAWSKMTSFQADNIKPFGSSWWTTLVLVQKKSLLSFKKKAVSSSKTMNWWLTSPSVVDWIPLGGTIVNGNKWRKNDVIQKPVVLQRDYWEEGWLF